MYRLNMAWWESGYPAVCKTAYTGSNPVQASKFIPDGRVVIQSLFAGSGIARRSVLLCRIWRSQSKPRTPVQASKLNNFNTVGDIKLFRLGKDST
jgi:hypothetical protein